MTAVACLTVMVLSCCRLIEADPPFQYLQAKLVVGAGEGCHELIGFHYGIRNLGAQPIVGLNITFRLYDESGSPLPLQNNVFDIVYSGDIPPQSERWICACLDSSFYFEPSGQITVEGFRIDRAELAEGSSWRDPIGIFPYPYEVNLESGTGGT